ncbi:MAG: hypothetical protein LBF76_00580 [Holosporales bacterium]|jgi:DNA polymerase-1|nr:hypothetical protein [Holosporales bacterium]
MPSPPFLIDGSGFVHRAFHAFPPLKDPQQRPVGALFGFIRLLFPFLEQAVADDGEVYVFFDAGRQTFRHRLYKEYKASRGPTDPDLAIQFPYVQQFCTAFGIPFFEHKDFEADDLIASAAAHLISEGRTCTVISSDKDLCQLIAPRIFLYDPMKRTFVTEEDVFHRYGVPPRKMRAFQALVGDASDCVPGVPGIGPKTAARLLQQYDTLEELYAHLVCLDSRLRKKLEVYREQAFLSQMLVTLRHDISLQNFPRKSSLVREQACTFLEAFSFSTLFPALERLVRVGESTKERRVS